MTNINEIEGIGEQYAEALKAVGITTVYSLLTAGDRPRGRQLLAERTGISPKLILRWVNHADLFRISGVAGQFAELLESAGVDSVAELARRNPENLQNTLVLVNQEKRLAGRTPSLSEVRSWIEAAKSLPPLVSH